MMDVNERPPPSNWTVEIGSEETSAVIEELPLLPCILKVNKN